MRSCPACGAEYTDTAIVCSDCQGTLTDGPAEVHADPSVEFVRWERVYGAPDQVAAVMLEGVLEAADIPVCVEAHTMAAYGPLPSSLKADSWGSLLVPAEDLDEAKRLIDDYLQGVAEGFADDGDDATEDSED
ncbi:MAG: DUF2007 domain-containing protein [Candidatus Poribacteria bacterium]